jgi:hypothetical protein
MFTVIPGQLYSLPQGGAKANIICFLSYFHLSLSPLSFLCLTCVCLSICMSVSLSPSLYLSLLFIFVCYSVSVHFSILSFFFLFSVRLLQVSFLTSRLYFTYPFIFLSI